MRIKKVTGKFKIKQAKPMPVSRSKSTDAQRRYREICLQLIDKISKDTKIDKNEFIKFLKLIRINLSSNYCKKFLIVISTSDPEAIADAYYSYRQDIDKYEHKNNSTNIKRFLRYLINSKNKTINVSNDFKIIDGVIDSVDDDISFNELNRCIGVLEDESM